MVTETKLKIIKVQYYSDVFSRFAGNDYTYYSVDDLKIGDVVNVPVKDSIGKAKVVTTDVPEIEVAKYKFAIKVIPSGSVIKDDKKGIPEMGTQLKQLDAIASEMTAVAEIVDHPENTAIIEIKPESNTGFIQLKDSLTSLKKYAEQRVIKSESDIIPATDDMALISKLKKELTTLKDKYVKPIRGRLDEVMDPFRELAGLLEAAEKLNKDKLSAFVEAQKKRAEEIAEVNRQAEEIARKQAALNDGVFTVDTTPIASPVVVHKVSTQLGSASIVNEAPNWEPENPDLIPKEYWMLDTVKIGRVIRAGGTIAGIKVTPKTGVRVTTK